MPNTKRTFSSSAAGRFLNANKMKCIIILAYVFLALFGLLLSKKVKINYNLSDYLGKDTETSIALDIMTDEFGMTGNIQVMLSGIEKDAAKEVKDTLLSIDGVLNVSFDVDSASNYKEETKTALFTILIDGEDHSDTAKNVISGIKSKLGDKYGDIELGGSTIEYNTLRENTGNEMGLIIVLSIALAAVLLLITASSWLDPLILLGCAGIAVGINMGLNIFIGEISYITKSVSSILQLALSVDYSIVLIHAYRDEKKICADNTTAMRKAVRAVVNPVSASALTTVAGFIALLFMSFRIGFDIGIVLIKGIVVSAITALTLLPAALLMVDPLIEKTPKRPFVPNGKSFSEIAFKASKYIAPSVLVIIIASVFLQNLNTYGFTDSIGTNQTIVDAFGRNDAIVVVYKTGEKESDYEKESKLYEALSKYKTKEGRAPLASYTAYTTTVREIYDLNKAVKVLGLPRSDVEMLFTMYNLYDNNHSLTLQTKDFVEFTNGMLASDPDVQNMVSTGTKDTVSLLDKVGNIMSNAHNAEELHTLLNEASPGNAISLFSVKQMYGLHYYDKISNPIINAETFFKYVVDNADNMKKDGLIDKSTQATINDLELLLNWYYTPLNKLLFVDSYNSIDAFMKSSYNYSEVLTEIQKIKLPTGSISLGDTTELEKSIQQLYIMYFYDKGRIPTFEMHGREFVSFLLKTAETNSAVKKQVTDSIKARLKDLQTVDKFLTLTTPLTNKEMCAKLNALQSSVSSVSSTSSISEDIISGVYIKYAIASEDYDLTSPMMAYELVDFISNNMKTNALLSAKMTEAHHEKVDGAKAMIASAEGLFIGEEYSRVLLGVVIPAEGPEMVEFIDYLIEAKDEIFGKDAHITGKVVSTYDLQAAFDLDNVIITVFTIISILFVILIIFKSLALPVILVSIIQGSVWISLSLCLVSGTLVFFMSYIVTTCILMGATVDYGILMSNNYIVYRRTMDKKESLIKAVDSAMPTVFTSGLILIVCGFVISLISSQNSISSVGALLAQGTIVSIIMIIFALPSLLYVLDGIILKLTLNDDQDLITRTKAGRAAVDFIKKLLSKILAPINKVIEEKRKIKEKAAKLRRAKEKRAQTIASKKAAMAADEAQKETAPRMTARMISKAIDEKRKQEKLEKKSQKDPVEEKDETEAEG